MMEVIVKFHMVLISKLGKGEGSAVISGTSKTREPLLGNLNWPQKQPACFFVIKPITRRCTNFANLFRHETLHVSDSSSVRNMLEFHDKINL